MLQGLYDPQLLPVDRTAVSTRSVSAPPPLQGLSVTDTIRRAQNCDDRIDVSTHRHRLFSIAFNQLANPLNSVHRGLVIL